MFGPSFASLLITAALALCSVAHAAPPKLGVQLWSVRNDLAKDYDGTLKRLAAAGVKGVEFAGFFGPYEKRLPDLKAKLDSLGMVAIGGHVKLAALADDTIEATVERYRQLGAHTLIVGYDASGHDRTGVATLAAALGRAAERLKPHGMRTGYHNHDEEMADVDGTTYWDMLARSSPKTVILQQDVGWTTVAGKDPIEYVRRYPGRTYSTHYKALYPDSVKGKKRIIGQDIINWPALYEANASVGATEWLIVEQEDYPDGMSPTEAVEASIAGLRKVLRDVQPKPAL
ncbi:MAG: sugar phosphate isomerase/epimerase [Rhodanobacteraceae bacterium]|nr:sugar phosphate isomerase/epimerase [Rhodanobacteraceae bacterium]